MFFLALLSLMHSFSLPVFVSPCLSLRVVLFSVSLTQCLALPLCPLLSSCLNYSLTKMSLPLYVSRFCAPLALLLFSLSSSLLLLLSVSPPLAFSLAFIRSRALTLSLRMLSRSCRLKDAHTHAYVHTHTHTHTHTHAHTRTHAL